MAIEITDELVAHVARLARLGLSSAEAAEIKGHFQKILQFVKTLDQLDLQSVDPSFFPLATHNVFREDEVSPSLGADGALRNAPARKGDQFMVPRIVADAAGIGGEPEESA